MRLEGVMANGTGLRPRRSGAGFTLLELLVVIGLIALLATLGLPAMRGFGESNTIKAATRQVMDDAARARQLAIANRTTVYMVFIAPNIVDVNTTGLTDRERNALANLYLGQYTGYGFFARRMVGDQPGYVNLSYFGEWRYLPNGIFIDPRKFDYQGNVARLNSPDLARRSFATNAFPVPVADGTVRWAMLPYIAFDGRGRISSEINNNGTAQDAVIPLVRGSVSFTRDPATKRPQPVYAQVEERPPNNSVDAFNRVRIDWLTGRARLERPQLQ